VKALSLRQPWASIIVDGPKRIENRMSRTWVRGWVLIHAAQTFDATALPWLTEQGLKFTAPLDLAPLMHAKVIAKRPDLPRGGIIGAMHITDCVQSSDSPFWMGPHGYVIDRVVKLPFTPCRGMLGFFPAELPPEIAAQVPGISYIIDWEAPKP
jgi:hypothetical protein